VELSASTATANGTTYPTTAAATAIISMSATTWSLLARTQFIFKFKWLFYVQQHFSADGDFLM